MSFSGFDYTTRLEIILLGSEDNLSIWQFVRRGIYNLIPRIYIRRIKTPSMSLVQNFI